MAIFTKMPFFLFVYKKFYFLTEIDLQLNNKYYIIIIANYVLGGYFGYQSVFEE